jgi:hypothetical protein
MAIGTYSDYDSCKDGIEEQQGVHSPQLPCNVLRENMHHTWGAARRTLTQDIFVAARRKLIVKVKHQYKVLILVKAT